MNQNIFLSQEDKGQNNQENQIGQNDIDETQNEGGQADEISPSSNNDGSSEASPQLRQQNTHDSALQQKQQTQQNQQKPIIAHSKASYFFIADNTHKIVEQKLQSVAQMDKKGNEDNEGDEDDEESPKKKVNNQKLVLCTQQTKYRVIKKACRRLDYKFNDDENADWDLYWSDTGIQPQRIQKMQPYQRINHFPGMQALAHKHHLSRNLKRMQRFFPNEYDFFPKTWVLPFEQNDFKMQFTKKKAKTFIVKPVASCQGRGIFLTRDIDSIDMKSGEQYVVQRYMHKPYLIDNLKFDMRIYVLVYGVDPLRIFVFREGLARFATEEYQGPFRNNLDNLFMHLTNYAINKNSENFEANEDSAEDDVGHKRSVSSVLKLIEEKEAHNGITAKKIWDMIDDIATKTLISAQPHLQHSYRSLQPDDLENSMCFEVLGIDIFLDEKIKPWLIEINSLASFATDSPLDKKIKYDVIYETIAMLNLSQKRKKKMKKERTEQFNRRQYKDPVPSKGQRDAKRKKYMQERDKWDLMICSGFERVYPPKDPAQQELYNCMIDQSRMLFNEFTNGSTRTQQPASVFQRADPRGMSKTNPLPKNKAADLASAQQLKEGNAPQSNTQKGQQSNQFQGHYPQQQQQTINNTKQQLIMMAPEQEHQQQSKQNLKSFPNPNNPYGGHRYQNFVVQGTQPHQNQSVEKVSRKSSLASEQQIQIQHSAPQSFSLDSRQQQVIKPIGSQVGITTKNQMQNYYYLAGGATMLQPNGIPIYLQHQVAQLDDKRQLQQFVHTEVSGKQQQRNVSASAQVQWSPQHQINQQQLMNGSVKNQSRSGIQGLSVEKVISQSYQGQQDPNKIQQKGNGNFQPFVGNTRQVAQSVFDLANASSQALQRMQTVTNSQNETAQGNNLINSPVAADKQRKNPQEMYSRTELKVNTGSSTASGTVGSSNFGPPSFFQQNRTNNLNMMNGQTPVRVECIAKTLQKQFPLIRLEQSLLVNGCMNSCPIHGINRSVNPSQTVSSRDVPRKSHGSMSTAIKNSSTATSASTVFQYAPGQQGIFHGQTHPVQGIANNIVAQGTSSGQQQRNKSSQRDYKYQGQQIQTQKGQIYTKVQAMYPSQVQGQIFSQSADKTNSNVQQMLLKQQSSPGIDQSGVQNKKPIFFQHTGHEIIVEPNSTTLQQVPQFDLKLGQQTLDRTSGKQLTVGHLMQSPQKVKATHPSRDGGMNSSNSQKVLDTSKSAKKFGLMQESEKGELLCSVVENAKKLASQVEKGGAVNITTNIFTINYK